MASFSPGGGSTSSTNASYVTIYILGNSTSAVAAMKRTSDQAKLTENSLTRAGKGFKSIGSNMTQLGYSLSRVSIPLALLGGYAIKSAIDFQTSMTLLRTQAGASQKEVAKLEGAVLKMGHSGFAANELSKALYPIRSDGFKGAEALEVLKASAAGAQVSGAELTLTANALGGALRTYGVKGPEAAAKAMDSLNATVGFGKFKLEELDDALTSGFLTAAKRAGIGLNETGDALDALARKSIPPQVEATRLQKTFIQFGTVTGIAQKYLGKIGISQLQLAKDMKQHGLIFALEDLKKHLGSLSTEEQNVVLGEAFGRSKGSANVGALLEALPEMKKIQKEREKYSTLQQALAIKERTTQFKIAEAVANLKNTLISLGTALIPVVIPALTKLAKVIQEIAEWFTKLPKPIRDATTYFGLMLVVGGPLLIFFGNLVKSVGFITSALGKIGPASDEAAGAVTASGLAEAFAPAALAALGVYDAIEAIKQFKAGESRAEALKARKAHRGALGASGYNGGGYGVTGHVRAGHTGPFTGLTGSVTASAFGGSVTGGEYAPGTLSATNPYNQANIPNLTVKIDLEGKQLAEATAKHFRDHSQSTATKHVAEAVNKYATHRRARESG